MPPTVKNTKLGDIKSDRPIYKPLLAALERSMKGLETPEPRIIPVAQLRINPRFRSRREDVETMVHNIKAHLLMRQEWESKILVMERSDGSLWVYDDCATVEAIQRVSPAMNVRCAVFKDTTK